MAVENGVVRTVEKRNVLVEIEPGAGCGSCEAKGACMMGTSGKSRTIWIENSLHADVGDRVSFKIEEKGVVLASIILYIFPVIMLVAGLVIGGRYSHLFGIDSDLASGVSGACGLAAAFIIIKIFSPRIKEKKAFLPILLDKLN